MATSRVLRLSRIDSARGALVLVKVDQQKNGASPLDLRLVGTDGEYPFVGTTFQNDLGSLRSKGYGGNVDEWSTILSALLLEDTEARSSSSADGVEAVATVNSKVSIVVRKNIGGISQRLGSITLLKEETEEIELFDWAAVAASSSDLLRAEVTNLQAAVKQEQEAVVKLNAQLDDLVKAKKEHEEGLLLKFAELLNAKKLKIRDQQRLLATAKVDPQTATRLQSSRDHSIRRNAGSSRTGKRKAHEDSMDDESDGSDRAAEPMGDAKDKEARAETPEPSDLDETEDEDSDADGFGPAPVASQASRRGLGTNDKALEASNNKSKVRPSPELVSQLPPRRELPFNKEVVTEPSTQQKAIGTPAPASQAPEDDDETDDDEL